MDFSVTLGEARWSARTQEQSATTSSSSDAALARRMKAAQEYGACDEEVLMRRPELCVP